jgi:hypothetical protein
VVWPHMRKCRYSVLIIFLSVRMLLGAEPGVGFISLQKKFIRDLFREKRYHDVIAETRRLRFMEPVTHNANDYDFFIYINYFLGGQYHTVVRGLANDPGAVNFQWRVLLSQSYLKIGMPVHALVALRNVPYSAIGVESRFPLLLRRAEAYLESRKYDRLLQEIKSAERFAEDSKRVSLLYDSVERHRDLPFKSVPLAVALSALIPGAGQVYTGKYLHGVLSFIGVLATAGGAWYFYKRNKDLSMTFMFFSGVFYIGNIYGAYNASSSVNEEIHRRFVGDVKKKFIPPYDAVEEVRNSEIFR